MQSHDTFEHKIDRLAEVAVKIGLDLQPGQELVMTSSLEGIVLARKITEHAYKAGASLVTTIYSDDQATLSRFQHAPDDAFDTAPGWLFEGMASAYKGNAARLAISAEDPNLLSGQDKNKVGRAGKARAMAYKPASEMITNFNINWNIVAAAHPQWAKAVFPNDPLPVAVNKLWDAIFAASRVDVADPVAAWKAHNASLFARQEKLNASRFSALHFRGNGTDLTIGLADDHRWVGGANRARNGVVCNPNIPTEEVFTTPHKERIDGVVRSTKPLSHQGSLIDGIEMHFEKGRIVKVSAVQGEDVLKEILETDFGSKSLGEIALVPHSSPISQTGLLFYNTLFDENASSHIALGQCYSECFLDAEQMSKEQMEAKGGNVSNIHIDWMIGSDQIDVDGIDANGNAIPLMRAGEWVD